MAFDGHRRVTQPRVGRRPVGQRVRQRAGRLAAVVLAGVVVGSAFSAAGGPSGAATRRTTATRVPAAKTQSPVARFDAPWSDYIRAVVADLDRFGAEIMRTHYRSSYVALNGYFAYSSGSLPPSCGRRVTYREIRGNAFYCIPRDYIAFDAQTLFPDLEEDFGTIALGMVIAHEFGHALQARTATKFPSVLQELQADCFAGAWLARAARSTTAAIAVDGTKIDDALIATLMFRDPPGIGSTAHGAHGNGFDRLGAVQRGFDNGAGSCVDFARNPPAVTATEFLDFTDFQNEGDLPYDTALEISEKSLQSYFESFDPVVAGAAVRLASGEDVAALGEACSATLLYQAFSGHCAAAGDGRVTLYLDGTRLRRLYDREGDAAVGFAMALSRAGVLQQRRGVAAGTPAAEQQRLCIAGGWLRAFSEGGTNSLSPDDLDEAVFVTLRLPQTSSAFELVRAARSGYLTPSRCGI
jgi:predicted metalloprotease